MSKAEKSTPSLAEELLYYCSNIIESHAHRVQIFQVASHCTSDDNIFCDEEKQYAQAFSQFVTKTISNDTTALSNKLNLAWRTSRGEVVAAKELLEFANDEIDLIYLPVEALKTFIEGQK